MRRAAIPIRGQEFVLVRAEGCEGLLRQFRPGVSLFMGCGPTESGLVWVGGHISVPIVPGRQARVVRVGLPRAFRPTVGAAMELLVENTSRAHRGTLFGAEVFASHTQEPMHMAPNCRCWAKFACQTARRFPLSEKWPEEFIQLRFIYGREIGGEHGTRAPVPIPFATTLFGDLHIDLRPACQAREDSHRLGGANCGKDGRWDDPQDWEQDRHAQKPRRSDWGSWFAVSRTNPGVRECLEIVNKGRLPDFHAEVPGPTDFRKRIPEKRAGSGAGDPVVGETSGSAGASKFPTVPTMMFVLCRPIIQHPTGCPQAMDCIRSQIAPADPRGSAIFSCSGRGKRGG